MVAELSSSLGHCLSVMDELPASQSHCLPVMNYVTSIIKPSAISKNAGAPSGPSRTNGGSGTGHQVFYIFLAATKQLYKWYFPSVRLSVRLSVHLSVRPSVCHTFLTMFPSSYHHEIFRSYSPILNTSANSCRRGLTLQCLKWQTFAMCNTKGPNYLKYMHR